MATAAPPQPQQQQQQQPPPRAQQPPPSEPPTDLFDSLLTLEDQFYTEGYNQGVADGLVAGRIEGRQLGLERGFQRFFESGRLQGRAIVWANRLRQGQGQGQGQTQTQTQKQKQKQAQKQTGDGKGEGKGAGTCASPPSQPSDARVAALPPLPANPRLAKHVSTLYALVETESLSTENTDEAVNEFDDRLRRAQGRAKIIERMVGEGGERRRGGDGRGLDPGSGKGEEGVRDV